MDSCLIPDPCFESFEYDLPSRKLTYPPKNGTFADVFPFPQVGYVNSLEGTFIISPAPRAFPEEDELCTASGKQSGTPRFL